MKTGKEHFLQTLNLCLGNVTYAADNEKDAAKTKRHDFMKGYICCLEDYHLIDGDTRDEMLTICKNLFGFI